MRKPFMILMAVAILIPLLDRPVEGQQIPEVLYNSDPGVQGPVWVSAATAVDPKGLVNDNLFAPPVKSTIESFFIGDPIAGCYRVEENYESRVDPADRSSLSKAVGHSAFVLIGQVEEVAYGFHFYTPGKLLRIVPSQVFHGEVLLDSYYIFFPVGEFSAGPYRICKSDYRYPSAPAIGDELLIMVPDNRVRSADDPYLELEEASSVVVLSESGAPELPEIFEMSAGDRATSLYPSKAELVAAVRQALRQKEELR